MSMHSDVKVDQEILLYSKQFGWIRGWARESKGRFAGLASFQVSINSKAMLGVSEMTINVNTWEVYDAEDVDALKQIAKAVTVPEWTR
ncbi:hypothetical protein SEA_DEJAVU_105 [Microbacterium Phage DejaVu]|nr:hypothetical protein LUPINE_103 [Microbacterium phage Lupine]QDH92251.1 hypothetical protein SEA_PHILLYPHILLY_102 [Microbacterium phage PhillyPhilly]QDK03347.1 hypothetical protein SEA_ROMAN_106 [Microbacterium phage Roman]QIG58649.1 hypothetical protein SEA_HUBBS_104 [Microbacterium phage Hubbs]WNM66237.1 hypothetical protein SEA_DEJAVU_105 [Microbacterium Phage DejaVu]